MNEESVNPVAASDKKLLTLAMVILALAVLLQLAGSTVHALQDRQALQLAMAKQEPVLAAALTVRRQLNSLADKTVQLGEQGNQSAMAIIEKMTAAGIKFSAVDKRDQNE